MDTIVNKHLFSFNESILKYKTFFNNKSKEFLSHIKAAFKVNTSNHVKDRIVNKGSEEVIKRIKKSVPDKAYNSDKKIYTYTNDDSVKLNDNKKGLRKATFNEIVANTAWNHIKRLRNNMLYNMERDEFLAIKREVNDILRDKTIYKYNSNDNQVPDLYSLRAHLSMLDILAVVNRFLSIILVTFLIKSASKGKDIITNSEYVPIIISFSITGSSESVKLLIASRPETKVELDTVLITYSLSDVNSFVVSLNLTLIEILIIFANELTFDYLMIEGIREALNDFKRKIRFNIIKMGL
jgi:hypothetical protein